VARYLLRNGSLLSIEVEPKLIDVLVFRNFSGEYIYAYSFRECRTSIAQGLESVLIAFM
jgi:hypothetical protein